MIHSRKNKLIIENNNIVGRKRTPIFNRGLICETGIIPEGFQFIQDANSFRITGIENVISEDMNKQPIHIMRVNGLFQESDVENANGRVYPYNILYAAIDVIQDDVDRRSVYGEYDHPCFTSSDFKVLTVDGWKKFVDVKIGDYVWSRVGQENVKSLVTDITNEAYSGLVYDIKNDNIDTTVTPKHKWLLSDGTYKTTEEIVKSSETFSIQSSFEDTNESIKLESVKESTHNGNIYCLTTEHGNFYVEQNGRSYWTGNSDAKLHLDRVCHLVTKVNMDGKKVFGEAEILDNQPLGRCLRGLFERKCQVGISSRGVGDMELQESNQKQRYIVQEGFQIITWDAVAEPSVKGALLNICEGKTKKTKPIREAYERGKLSKQAYDSLLIEEINKLFRIEDKVPRRKPKSPKSHSTSPRRSRSLGL